MENPDERILVIEKLRNYKLFLEKNGPKLSEDLQKYYHQDSEKNVSSIEGFPKGEGPRKVDYICYDNPYEAYLNAQIQVGDALLPILEQHIAFLEDDEDIDLVLESFEHSVYQVKKQTFSDVDDWEQLLDHLSEDRLEEIKNNPRGHGDLLIKELIWIRNYEEKWMKK
jgi:bacterioferritin